MKTRLLFLWLTMAMLSLVGTSAMAQTEIWTLQDLKNVKNNLSGQYILMADIDCGSENWVPLPYFYGTFNGNGHTITYRITNSSESRQGLFKGIDAQGKVSSLIVKGSISGSCSESGGIAGYNLGTIINCYSAVDVNSSGGWIGGIAGSVEETGEILFCSASGVIGDSNSSKESVGGIAGYLLAYFYYSKPILWQHCRH